MIKLASWWPRRASLTGPSEKSRRRFSLLNPMGPSDQIDSTSREPLSLPPPSSPTSNSDELFDLLHRLQSARLDDQRCSMPAKNKADIEEKSSKSLLEDILRSNQKPLPMIVLPKSGGYWLDQCSSKADSEASFELDEITSIYRTYFFNADHQNLHGFDHLLGPVVLSLRSHIELGRQQTRVILRLQSGTRHQILRETPKSALRAAQILQPDLSLERLQPILSPRASELIVNYDEHGLDRVFKFGLVYQKCGQITEEALFGNNSHSSAMDEFMDLLGKRVNLAEHRGYSGGLDTRFGQTGDISLYDVFEDREIMFHVSTLLPHNDSDSQQLQKKRHIGNDIVAVIFQEGDTVFTPDMITSHFLHAFVIVQPVRNENDVTTHYKLSVTARTDVPAFGPQLPAVMAKGPQLKRFLLTKLINAQHACLKADEFAKLEQRTRSTLLANLEDELSKLTDNFVGNVNKGGDNSARSVDGERRQSRLMETVKKALAGRTRSQQQIETESTLNKLSKSRSSSSNLSLNSKNRNESNGGKADSGRGSVGSASSPVSSPDTPARESAAVVVAESDDSSLNSVELDSGTRRGSTMPQIVSGPVTTVTLSGGPSTLERYQDEISRLRVEKLELLRQHVSAQREVKRLREREVRLQADLTNVSTQLHRFKQNADNERKTSAPNI